MPNTHLRVLETRILKTLEDTQQLAHDIVSRWHGTRLVIGLQGEMGTGKTHFVKALVKELGLSAETANSPSYAIHQQYEGKNVVIHHLDLFRLQTDEDIESSGFWDLFYEDNVILAVEWIDRIDEAMIPQNFWYLRMDWQLLTDGSRQVTLRGR